MLNSPIEHRDEEVDEVVARGPRGALALAGIATFIVVAIWLAFYLLVFMPRGPAP
jgi:hypothetical protein